MNRLLTGTAVGLLLGLTPALAQNDAPAGDTPAPAPPAVQEPASPPEAVPMEPSKPGEAIPGQSSEVPPAADDQAPGAATLDKPVSPDDAGKAIEESAKLDAPKFASEQASDEWLASNLIGQPVVNAKNETIGDINDLVTDKDGKVAGVLVGSGGFLGIGEKEVALRYEDLDISRNPDDTVTIKTDVSREMLASAPDYKRLGEQELTVGNTLDVNKDKSAPSEPGTN